MSQNSKSAALKTQIKNMFKSKAKIEEEQRKKEEERQRKQELEDALALRQQYTHFRILVIGRANAGKTTLLKRVCNTDEDPCVYDEENKNLIEPTAERGIHDVNHPFSFKSNPAFIFHDSPGFEKGGVDELKKVQAFIAEKAKARNVKDQIHAIWFCFYPDAARPLLQLEKNFFSQPLPGNVPVVAIFTKLDDLVAQVMDWEKSDDENEALASKVLKERFQEPLQEMASAPRAYISLNELHKNDSNHQDQVKELIKKTEESLDHLALKLLFTTVQGNNLELCIESAIRYTYITERDQKIIALLAITWFPHIYYNKNLQTWKNPPDEEPEEQFEFMQPFLQVFSATFKDPSVCALAAVLICLENSFWLCKQGELGIEAMKSAWQQYLVSRDFKVKQQIQDYLLSTNQGDWFTTGIKPTKENQAIVKQIVLDNLLAKPIATT